MINSIIDLMIEEGLDVPSREDTYEGISDAVVGGKIRSIIRDGKIIGFFTWKEIYKNDKLYIFIENMCIKRRFRNRTNLLCLRDFFRNCYQDRFEFVYWHNQRKDKFFYCKREDM